MDFTDNVLECLYQEDCFIEYMSINSGRTLEGWFTLAGDKMGCTIATYAGTTSAGMSILIFIRG